ncbi:MAG: ABC transporter permease [Bacteroidales bacterium]
MIFFGLLRESFQFAYQALILNKLRTFLSLLGITIGIFSIISVLTSFDALEKSIRNNISSLGSDVLYIQKWPFGEVGQEYKWWQYYQRPQPTSREMSLLTRNSNTVGYAAFSFDVSRTVEFESNNLDNIDILCVSQDFNQIRSINIQRGRFFTPIESNGGQAVAVIGHNVYSNLFGTENPIGKDIKIAGYKVMVIGVMTPQGEGSFGGPGDDQVIVPSSFAQKFAQSRRINTSILVSPRQGISAEQMKDEVTGIFRSIRSLRPNQDNNFAINQVDILMKSLNKVFAVVGIVGWIVGGFSLIVGGFGIANIMFVSVKERTSQIGIQKSLGAKNNFILQQFLFESVFLSILGGILGLIIIFILSLIVRFGFDIPVGLSVKNISIGIGISLVIGVIAGYLPAYSASKLDPVEAIRQSF